jgi:hypothetical protein
LHFQAAIRCLHIVQRCGKRMLGREPVVGDEDLRAAARSDMANQVAEGVRGSPAEPTAVQVLVAPAGVTLATDTVGPVGGVWVRPARSQATEAILTCSMRALKGSRAEIPWSFPFIGATSVLNRAIVEASCGLTGWITSLAYCMSYS